jgi:hypothetical protein
MAFGWGAMVNRAKRNAKTVADLTVQVANVSAYMWNHAKATLPDFIIEDYENFACQVPPLQPTASVIPDRETGLFSRKGTYNFEWAGENIQFKNTHLAPPCVFLTSNYSRLVLF